MDPVMLRLFQLGWPEQVPVEMRIEKNNRGDIVLPSGVRDETGLDEKL